MAPIPDIGVRYIYVPPVPDWSIPTPDSIPQAPPVTLNLGWPIVELPGCVEARETSGNNQLLEDDPQGNLTLCMDASFPSFQPMDYDPDQLVVLPLKNPVKLPPLGGLDGKKDKGNEAKLFVEEMLKNGKVINLHNLDKDKYFRIVADVKVDGKSIGEALVENGHAYPYDGGTKKDIDWCLPLDEQLSPDELVYQ